ncbi:MAG: DNA polymerase III subunit alpha, partial [Anaeroplasmataceae bacterium]|nr:DNA polymerase III subunit alpha [Anaeroplasmataceae bacterium]
LYIVRGLEGLPRHISTHAAGIIISSCPLDDLVPLQEGLNGLYQSEFEAADLEKIGLLKMDFLGIRNLTIIEDVIKQIPKFDMSKLRSIPLNDPNTLRLLQNADTLGVFQLESAGIRRVLSNLHCESFEDLVAVLALYRPGPMDNIDEFIARKHGKKFTYPHPVLEPILKSTYGIIVYQEQIMMIAQRFANFSLGQADLLRRAISKKKESELQKLRQCFIEGAKKNGYSILVAENIYEYILKFANYGFNKSHSVAYGLLAYQMAYLKANYFNIFISKILNNVIGSTKTMEEYIQYAKTRGVETCKPNINISTTIFEVRDRKMFMPLDAIHSIGVSIAKEIVEERNAHGPYKSFQEFKERNNLNTSILEALIYAGALDDFKMTKKQMINSKESYNEIFSRHLEDKIEDTSEFDFGLLKEKEQFYLGFNLTYNLFTDLPNLQRKYHTSFLSNQNNRSIISFEQVKEILTKKQEAMLVGKVNDHKQVVDFVIFPIEYQSLKINIDRNHLYVVDYKMEVDKKTNQNKIIIRNVMQV